ncbi:MAG: phenylalanine--tRNA ligase subunit alpha [Pseudomonadota bacterium]|nr:phenylalanine--tRNA ligase subunit alpha [Pseudomonadota bacterium]MEC9414551.1 phenylalanine--tRNA ligase subunit alpha [Pseudomonadota bacterium]
MENFESLKKEILQKIISAENEDAVEKIRVEELGKKGRISKLLNELGSVEQDKRKIIGPKVNDLKKIVSEKIQDKKEYFMNLDLDKRLLEEKVDITLPVKINQNNNGRIHPVSQVLEEISEIFGSLGYEIADGPDIESEYYNFNALNIPDSHPARQMHDTFYLQEYNGDEGQSVLRTHTSPVQVRTMENGKPPFKFISPGRTYRCDSDQTHTPMFHQIEGLAVDENTNLGHLKWTLETFLSAFFEIENTKIQMRPSYFPFTEPSIEIDVLCDRSGSVLKIGEGSDWLEVAGAGMVHPNVLKSANINPEKYQGFAFGFGLDRLAQLKYGIPDLRTFFNGDIRWLKHYGFAALDIPTLSRGLKK